MHAVCYVIIYNLLKSTAHLVDNTLALSDQIYKVWYLKNDK